MVSFSTSFYWMHISINPSTLAGCHSGISVFILLIIILVLFSILRFFHRSIKPFSVYRNKQQQQKTYKNPWGKGGVYLVATFWPAEAP